MIPSVPPSKNMYGKFTTCQILHWLLDFQKSLSHIPHSLKKIHLKEETPKKKKKEETPNNM